MGLLSIFKRNDDSPGAAAAAPGAAAAAPDAVTTARVRARRRLMGATVLLGVGVIGFPLLFETQPRPIPVDIPIEIPRKEGAPPLAMPAARPASTVAQAQPLPQRPPPASAPLVPVERAGEQGREVLKAAPATAASQPPPAAAQRPQPASAAVASTARPATAQASAPTAATAAAAATSPAASPGAESARAQALLDGRAVASEPASLRIVVQVGAYADADKLREARQKVEKLGLKTYVQVVEVDGAKRTRVRVGPFDSRDDAEKTAARIRATGLPVQLLTL